MIITKPYYYDQFKCIADKCKDSCCIGWEVGIDPESKARFEAEEGELGDKLKQKIKDSSFILDKEERCPFLLKNGLCELICKKDDKYICEICREHPRYHEWYGNYHDSGLGLCCEEACRLLFSDKKPVYFIVQTKGESKGNDDEDITFLLEQRSKLAEHFTDRTLPLSQRFSGLSDIDSISLAEIIGLCKELEPFDLRWTQFMDFVKDGLDSLLTHNKDFLAHISERVYEYEHLTLYLLHRYFMKSLYLYFPDSVLRGIAIYLGIQYLFDLYCYKNNGKFDLCDRIDSAKYISKQLEYSEENIDIIMNT